jgi:hypothetical protein
MISFEQNAAIPGIKANQARGFRLGKRTLTSRIGRLQYKSSRFKANEALGLISVCQVTITSFRMQKFQAIFYVMAAFASRLVLI